MLVELMIFNIGGTKTNVILVDICEGFKCSFEFEIKRTPIGIKHDQFFFPSYDIYQNDLAEGTVPVIYMKIGYYKYSDS